MVLKIVYWATTIVAAAMLRLAVTYLTGSAQIVAAINHLVLLALLIVSYLTRPASRRLAPYATI